MLETMKKCFQLDHFKYSKVKTKFNLSGFPETARQHDFFCGVWQNICSHTSACGVNRHSWPESIVHCWMCVLNYQLYCILHVSTYWKFVDTIVCHIQITFFLCIARKDARWWGPPICRPLYFWKFLWSKFLPFRELWVIMFFF